MGRKHLAKFFGGCQADEVVTSTYVVSMDNPCQTGPYFEEFVGLICRHNESFSHFPSITILLTDALYKFYVSDEAALAIKQEWLVSNEASIKTLREKGNCIVDIKAWEDVVEKAPEFADYLAKAKGDYNTDEFFKNTVDQLANKYRVKCEKYTTEEEKFQAAVDYLLSECAGAVCIAKGLPYFSSPGVDERSEASSSLAKFSKIIYPARMLNDAILCFAKLQHTAIPYKGYACKLPGKSSRPSSPSDVDLSSKSSSVSDTRSPNDALTALMLKMCKATDELPLPARMKILLASLQILSEQESFEEESPRAERSSTAQTLLSVSVTFSLKEEGEFDSATQDPCSPSHQPTT